jgi:hypothetical protein
MEDMSAQVSRRANHVIREFCNFVLSLGLHFEYFLLEDKWQLYFLIVPEVERQLKVQAPARTLPGGYFQGHLT